MYWTLEQTTDFVTKNYHALKVLTSDSFADIVLCPSAIALHPVSLLLAKSGVHLGAQDCSDQTSGAFTGQISALSLASLGCRYGIIGHSERRRYNSETDQNIAAKCMQLITAQIIPIICVGETAEQKEKSATFHVLEEQLSLIIKQLVSVNAADITTQEIFIAYEPVWAIGTGLVPTTQYLESVFNWLSSTLEKTGIKAEWRLIYGGSVSSKNIDQIKAIRAIDGFLIGGASLDFQEFEKIVKYKVKS